MDGQRDDQAAQGLVLERFLQHDRLSLQELRDYRRVLGEQEHNVSYWRRILQARLDVVRAELAGGSRRVLHTDALPPLLAEARTTAGRDALVAVLPVDDIPPLPRLAELWKTQVAPGDTDALTVLEADLSAAERQLSDYRAALHRRIGAATDELIARYRARPELCLSALPLRGQRPAATA